MPTFLHAADIHLDAPLRGLARYPGAPVDRVRNATRDAFARMVDLAIDERVAAVVLAGDVYDGALRDDAASGLWLHGQLLRLRAAKIPVVLLVGNHDAECSFRQHVRLPDNVFTFSTHAPETKVYEHLGLAFHGQGYPSRRVDTDLAAKYPPPVPGLLNVGVLHTALEGREGHAPYAPCTVDGLRARGYGYWALGHVHNHDVVARDPWIVFPGNLQGRGFFESAPKGCVLVSWEGDRVTSAKHRPCDVVRWTSVEVDASGAADLDEVAHRAERALEHARDEAEGRLLMAHLEVKGATPAHGRLMREQAQARAELRARSTGLHDVWLTEIQLRTLPELDLAALQARDDAIGAVAAPLDEAHGLEELVADLSAALTSVRSLVPEDLMKGLPTTREELERGLQHAQAELLGLLLQADEETT